MITGYWPQTFRSGPAMAHLIQMAVCKLTVKHAEIVVQQGGRHRQTNFLLHLSVPDPRRLQQGSNPTHRVGRRLKHEMHAQTPSSGRKATYRCCRRGSCLKRNFCMHLAILASCILKFTKNDCPSKMLEETRCLDARRPFCWHGAEYNTATSQMAR